MTRSNPRDNVATLAFKFSVRHRYLLLALAVCGALAVSILALHDRHRNSGTGGSSSDEMKAILLCEQNQENLKEFAEIAYDRVGIRPVLAEPRLLELLADLERKRDDLVKNLTNRFGHPDASVQDGEKVLTWHRPHGNENADNTMAKTVVDYSLPVTVFGNPRTVCNLWRTSFLLFYKDGLMQPNGTAGIRMSQRLADLSRLMKAAGFTVAVFEGDDPRLTNALPGVDMRGTDPLLLHMRFFRGKHNIYVTVLYERSESGVYWHSNLLTGTGAGSKSPVHFGSHAGSWKWFSSRMVHLDFGVNALVPGNITAFLADFYTSHFIECNMGRAARFLKSYPPSDAADDITFVANARKALLLGRNVLDELKIPFWMSSGTCLGWFRQCSIIPHSKDVDFGIRIKDYSEHLVMHMLMKGFKIKHRFGKESDSLELTFQFKDIKLDMFFFYEDHDSLWNGGTQARTGKKYKYVFPKFSLCWTEFVGLRVRVPCSTQSYIEANYGLTWDQPVKQWDWKASPPNVHENGKWHETEMAKVVQVY